MFDSASQENLISEDIVKKLNLKTIPHPKPYPLGWLCENSKLKVRRKCTLKLPITTNFIDEVELDLHGIVWEAHTYMIGKPSFIAMRKSIICLKVGLSILLEHITRR